MYIRRLVQKTIEAKLFSHNVIVIYGPRQSGKTTMVKNILEPFADAGLYWNCEDPDIFSLLKSFEVEKIRQFFIGKRIVVFDEAQRIPNIGMLLKLLFDTYPDTQYIATGSSSFELSQQVGEPLVGRSWEFTLYPFGISEVVSEKLAFIKVLDTVLVYGTYPEIWHLPNDEKEVKLKTIASQYLYKDLLVFEGIRNSTVLQDLLKLLAGQLGNEVSYNELATILGTSRQTVIRYIDILEKSFVIFRLPTYVRNVRGRVGKKFKAYFYDLGIRNTIVNQFGIIDPLARNDVGALWENFCILERRKFFSYEGKNVTSYFWRGRVGEVDYLEEANGKISAFEFKWNAGKRAVPPVAFERAAHPESFVTVHKENFFQELLQL